ncbi:MAG: mitochondrial fission ELM1 family protein [Rhodospirillales bacterium]|nr:mitochondrial fission ELM1 family protein [Alphaproteobacteria bacterium]MCB9987576.1 mitochondrial fission ELM1 family protein [Rhodospirillales bacterium]USO07705.1 MAG: mitochondrial fission ELM1 family protein [Rhodospirillales bacterium]
MTSPTHIVWILVEKNLIGTENQCLGVAEALGHPYTIKRFTLRQPWKSLSPYLICGIGRAGYRGDALTAPWPDILICGGRKAAGVALWVKRQSPKTFTVCLLDPRARRAEFDLIAAPAHDRTPGKNVVETTGAPNRVTPARLTVAADRWRGVLAPDDRKRIAVLIGGNTKHYTLSDEIARKLGNDLRALADHGYRLMLTASRRTPPPARAILENALTGCDAFIWDGQGENPYTGMLALADAILVTADSVSMTAEAATTGKPVYRIDLEGESPRIAAFHARLGEAGIARPFTGKIENWSYAPLNDAGMLAQAIIRRYADR